MRPNLTLRTQTTSRGAHEIGRGGASIQIEFTGINRGRLGGKTFVSNHWIPPASQKKGNSTITRATLNRTVLGVGRLIVMELQSKGRVAAKLLIHSL
jgi:hypothetical protein